MTVHKDLDPIGQCEWPRVKGFRGPVQTTLLLGATEGLWEGDQVVVPVSVARELEAELDALKARIEEKIQNHDRYAEIDEKASRTTEDQHFKSESFSMRAAHHRIRAEALRSLLNDREEEK